MRLVLWAKDRSGKWQVFPFHLLTTFADGKKGFTVAEILKEVPKWEVWYDFHHCFESHHTVASQTIPQRYLLKDQE